MRAARPLLLAGALGAAPLLSGCVAAALPLLAAGGVAQSHRQDNASSPTDSEEPQVSGGVSVPIEPVEAEPDPAAPDPVGASFANGASAPQLGSENAPVRAVGDGLSPSVAGGDGTVYQALYEFAAAQARIPVAGGERHSAILARPLDLRPETKECSIHPAAVLIDLDPAGATLDPAAAVNADAKLAATLARVREEGVVIGWITASSADRAGDVRSALVDSGLDPDGHDELVLLRYPEERKQTRREAFAKDFCLVAIAGDNRGDFDELYDYIKNPFLAAPLDALLGNGWFLIPQPLT